MSVECKSECPKNSSYTIFFEFTDEDAVQIGSLKTMYDIIMNGNMMNIAKPGSIITAGQPIGSPLSMTLDCDINTENMGLIFGMWMLNRFKINPKRVCDVELTPLPDIVNLSRIKMKFTLGPTIDASSTKYPNDKYSSECIKNIVLAWILQYKASLETDVEQWLASSNGQETIGKCSAYTSDVYKEIEYIPDIINPLLGKFSNIRIEQYTNPLIEEITNARSFSGTSTRLIEGITGAGSFAGTSTPSTILDYIFIYSLPLSFIGSIAYALLAIMQTDIASVGVNKNILLVLYIYIFLCGFFSSCVWYNIDIVNFSIADKKISDWFSLGVIKTRNE